MKTLLGRAFDAAREVGAAAVGVAGGVSANRRLREDLAAMGARRRLAVFVPPVALSTDNAAMIAAAGLRLFARGLLAGERLNAVPSLPLG